MSDNDKVKTQPVFDENGRHIGNRLSDTENPAQRRRVHNGDGVKVDVKREPRKPTSKGEVRNG